MLSASFYVTPKDAEGGMPDGVNSPDETEGNVGYSFFTKYEEIESNAFEEEGAVEV